MKNKKLTVKIMIDIGMTACLLLLMPYSLLGETLHEWIGMAMFVLFIAHHILNRKWLGNGRKRKIHSFQGCADSTGDDHVYTYDRLYDKRNTAV